MRYIKEEIDVDIDWPVITKTVFKESVKEEILQGNYQFLIDRIGKENVIRKGHTIYTNSSFNLDCATNLNCLEFIGSTPKMISIEDIWVENDGNDLCVKNEDGSITKYEGIKFVTSQDDYEGCTIEFKEVKQSIEKEEVRNSETPINILLDGKVIGQIYSFKVSEPRDVEPEQISIKFEALNPKIKEAVAQGFDATLKMGCMASDIDKDKVMKVEPLSEENILDTHKDLLFFEEKIKKALELEKDCNTGSTPGMSLEEVIKAYPEQAVNAMNYRSIGAKYDGIVERNLRYEYKRKI